MQSTKLRFELLEVENLFLIGLEFVLFDELL
jgi:hypothetical protein